MNRIQFLLNNFQYATEIIEGTFIGLKNPDALASTEDMNTYERSTM